MGPHVRRDAALVAVRGALTGIVILFRLVLFNLLFSLYSYLILGELQGAADFLGEAAPGYTDVSGGASILGPIVKARPPPGSPSWQKPGQHHR